MTDAELRKAAIEVLCEVCPEVEPDTVVPDEDLRDQLDLDSMDFLNFVIALHKRLGVEIPEVDYPKLNTVNGAVAYLGDRIA